MLPDSLHVPFLLAQTSRPPPRSGFDLPLGFDPVLGGEIGGDIQLRIPAKVEVPLGHGP